MKNPKALELAKSEMKSLAKEQGGTCCEGTSMLPQAKQSEPAEGTRSGGGGK